MQKRQEMRPCPAACGNVDVFSSTFVQGKAGASLGLEYGTTKFSAASVSNITQATERERRLQSCALSQRKHENKRALQRQPLFWKKGHIYLTYDAYLLLRTRVKHETNQLRLSNKKNCTLHHEDPAR